MEETNTILLNSSRNKKSVNENVSLNVSLNGNKLLLPEDAISDKLDMYETYLDERKNSNKFRLIVNVKPFCSNVLFNPITEIVKYEGSSSATCLNYIKKEKVGNKYTGYTEDNSVGKSSEFAWSQYDAIRDTQLSNEACEFDYHCGIDIFNNHILRNKAFKAVNFNEENKDWKYGNLGYDEDGHKIYGDSYNEVKVTEKGNDPNGNHKHNYVIEKDFNTIDDYMRDKNGYVIPEEFPTLISYGLSNIRIKHSIVLPLHLYQKYDIMTYKESIKENLFEENGWYGFKNKSIVGTLTLKSGSHQSTSTTYSFDIDRRLIYDCTEGAVNVNVKAVKEEETVNLDAGKLNINRVINNRPSSDFIDMYPGRDLFSFTPKYNKYRRRTEKNWNYCLTYPYKNEIDFPFLKTVGKNTYLKVYMIDEGTVDDDETALLTIYTICQHGLMVGDRVNVHTHYSYEEDGETIHEYKLPYDSSEVVNVVDKYIFQIVKDSANISEEWVEVEDRGTGMYNGVYPICESNRCNIDPKAQDIYICRVDSGVECNYYVRKFARIPNFKFKDCEINDYTLYGKGNNSTIQKYSGDFESHIAKLGFANTAYGDDTSEIVFTDDIDISYLRDNFGRPLSDVYLTIVKNNKGYKEWYGIGDNFNISADTVEYSHCFGKVNGSFLLSDYFREQIKNGIHEILDDVRDLDSTSNYGLTTSIDSDGKKHDDINFDDDWDYYGDICCYSPIDCNEQVIQNAMFRFNTVQRELPRDAKSYSSLSDGVKYDEIVSDENTILYDDFEDKYSEDPYSHFESGHSSASSYVNVNNQKEGYYYQAHYRIPFKTVSKELKSEPSIEYEIIDSSYDKNTKLFNIKISENRSFSNNSKLVLYKRSENEIYYVVVKRMIASNRFECIIDDFPIPEQIETLKLHTDDFVLLEKHPNAPDYAKVIKDGSCRYYWRDIISNGVENNTKVYPFTNGAFYVMRQINFFLRRQDPKKENLGRVGDFDYNPKGEDISNYPNFMPDYISNYDENEIESC